MMYLIADDSDLLKFLYWFFTDISFFIIIKLVALSLIAGIIIDAFSEMRDELI